MDEITFPCGVRVHAYRSPLDGTIVVHIDTPPEEENTEGPLVRIYLNDSVLFENPVFPMEKLINDKNL
jgi:hypothetical protein